MKKFITKKIIIAGIIFIFMIVAAIIIPGTKKTEALSMTYFGGRRLYNFTCTCVADPGVLVYIYDYASNSTKALFYNPLLTDSVQKFYAYQYNPLGATNLLGSFTPGGTCLMQAYPSCTSGPTADGMFSALPGTGTSGQ